MSKIPILPQLKKALEAAKSFTAGLLSEFATTTAGAIEEVEALKVDKRNAVTVTIPTSGWVSDTSVSAYPYKYEISVSSVTAKDFCIINIAPSSQAAAKACRLCPTNETIAGKIILRATKIPTSSIMAEYWLEKGKET